MDNPNALLEIKNLCVNFYTNKGIVQAVNNVYLKVKKGEILGIVGESGSGKSVTALSVLGLIKAPGRITCGQIFFKGQDLLKLHNKELQNIRGAQISMIFQEPMTSLNPVLTIGDQIAEVLVYHNNLSKKTSLIKAKELLDVVNIPNSEIRLKEYPHQLSGGMRQRVMIAIALACNPSLILADEPTTALDVTIQAQIMELLKNLREQFNTSIILITHDISILNNFAENVAVMYCGRICEYSKVTSLLKSSKHPYTSGLIGCMPQFNLDKEFLPTIPGMVPSPYSLPAGCKFHPRCEYAMTICKHSEPKMKKIGDSLVKCWLYG